MPITHKVWRITQVKRLRPHVTLMARTEYDHEIYFHRHPGDRVHVYHNPRCLHLLYIAIGRQVNDVDMTSIGNTVITRYYIGGG